MEQKEIYTLIDAKRKVLLPQLNNPSVTSEYKLWQHVIAFVLGVIFKLLKVDTDNISSINANNRGICTFAYFKKVALEFQWNAKVTYRLLVKEDGTAEYNIVVPEDRIVSQVSAIVDSDALIIVKIASGKETLEPLTSPQLVDFSNYMLSLSIPGIKLNCISDSADKLSLNADITYDKAMNSNLLIEDVKEALKSYSKSVGFDGKVKKNEVIDAIQGVMGIKDVYLNSLTLTSSAGEIVEIEKDALTKAGYFNIESVEIVLNAE